VVFGGARNPQKIRITVYSRFLWFLTVFDNPSKTEHIYTQFGGARYPSKNDNNCIL
jgi:hypothetical protein